MSSLSYEFLCTKLRNTEQLKVDTFLNSPLYYLLTGRKGAWMYQSQKSTLVVCAHPHIDGRLLVFPEIGKADYELTASVLNMIDPPPGGVQLARYCEEEITALKQQLAKLNYTPVSGISVTEEDMMDWRYPVRILDTAKVAAMQGQAFSRIRNKFRKAGQDVKATPLGQDTHLRMMRAALKFWEGNMIANNKDTEDMHALYDALLKIIKTEPARINGLLFHQGRRPAGFTIWDEPYRDTANILVNLGDTTITGLSDFQLVSTCARLRDDGVAFANMGGSELESLDAFKAKFQPANTVRVLSANVLYRKAENTNIVVQTIIEPIQAR